MTAGVLIASVVLTIGPPACVPEWQTDYASARKAAAAEKRPLAVFFGSGTNGFHQVCREGRLKGDVQRLLLENYLCVYVDVAKPSTKTLVESFAIQTGKGLVLSDRTCSYEALRHEGELSAHDLLRHLQRHAEGTSESSAEPYLTLTVANFEAEVLQCKRPVLVDFHADWCGPCQRMGPIVAELAADYRGHARVGKLNTDQNRAIAAKYGISSIPAFLIFQDGQVVDRLVGATSKSQLASRLNAVLKEKP